MAPTEDEIEALARQMCEVMAMDPDEMVTVHHLNFVLPCELGQYTATDGFMHKELPQWYMMRRDAAVALALREIDA